MSHGSRSGSVMVLLLVFLTAATAISGYALTETLRHQKRIDLREDRIRARELALGAVTLAPGHQLSAPMWRIERAERFIFVLQDQQWWRFEIIGTGVSEGGRVERQP